MAKAKGAHHRGTHQVRARKVVDAARVNPLTKCWRCGLTLDQHPKHKTGRPPRWTAGHLIDGQVNGPLLPEVSVCNFSAGAAMGNQKRKPKRTTTNVSRTWS